ncbi:MAG: hypothetical protein K6A74_03890 [Lachnospiraceae bacterium]|nr:hypothetical protein [Lachnospiraceae bacterium]
MWKKIFEFLTYPIEWFWDKAEEAWKNKQYTKAILIGIASLLGIVAALAALAYLLYLIWVYLKSHPRFTAISIFIVFLYGYVKYNRKNVKINASDISVDATQIKQEAKDGYFPMKKAVFLAIQDIANDYGMIKPKHPEEIEICEEPYVIRDNLCIYQFKIEKQNYSTSCDKSRENELQYQLQNKIKAILLNGDCSDITILDYHDQYGNRLDGVVVDRVREIESCFYVDTVYASEAYMKYRRNRELNRNISKQKHTEVVEEWKGQS